MQKDINFREKKIQAIILKSKKYGEIDKLVFLLSPKAGVIIATAYGSLKQNSRFQGKLEQFSLVNSTLYTKKENIFTLKEVEFLKNFDNLVANIEKIFIANFFCEIILKCSTAGEDEKIFNLLYNSLFYLNKCENIQNNVILINFLLRYIFWTGTFIFSDYCSSCGKNIGTDTLFIKEYDFLPYCSSCIDDKAFLVDYETKIYIESIMRHNIKDSIDIFLSKEKVYNLKKILVEQIKFISGQNFKSLENLY